MSRQTRAGFSEAGDSGEQGNKQSSSALVVRPLDMDGPVTSAWHEHQPSAGLLTKADETAATAAFGERPARDNCGVETALDAFTAVAHRLQGPVEADFVVAELSSGTVNRRKEEDNLFLRVNILTSGK